MNIFRYATTEDVEDYLKLDSPSASGTRRDINRFIRRASAAINSYTKRSFVPIRKTLVFDLDESDYLSFDEDILAVNGLSHFNGASEFDSGAYHLRQGETYNREPYDNLIVDDTTGSLFNFTSTPIKAIYADVEIGYNANYTDAWKAVGGSLTEDVASATSIINVGASSEYSDLFFRGAFNEGDLLKIEEEFIYVRSGSGASNINVLRGVNGTTAASHGSGTQIYTFFVEDDIHYSAVALAAWQREKRESPYQNRIASIQMGTIEMPETWPSEILDKIKNYKRHTIRSI